MNILIIDDHQIFSESLSLLLRMRLNSCKTTIVNTVEDAKNALNQDVFSLCICDLYLPKVDGFSFLRTLNSDYPKLPALVLSSSEKTHDIAEAVNTGAKGFLNKSANSDEVLVAVNALISGNSYFSSKTKSQLKTGSKIHITRKQKEVLGYLAEGLNNLDIAERMFISELTVKTHVRDLMSAVSAKNRNNCVYIAREMGLIK